MAFAHFFKRFLFPMALLLWAAPILAACGGGQPEAQPRSQGDQSAGNANKIYMPITSGSQNGGQPADARAGLSVELNIPSATLKVGEIFTATATVSGANQPTFYMNIQDEGAAEATVLAQISPADEATLEGTSAMLEVVSTQATGEQVVIVLKAKAAGATRLWVRVSDADQKEGQSQAVGISVSD